MGPLGFEPRTDGLKVTSSRFILAILALPWTTSKTSHPNPSRLRTYVRISMITGCREAHFLTACAASLASRLKRANFSCVSTTPTGRSSSLVETLDLNLIPLDISPETPSPSVRSLIPY